MVKSHARMTCFITPQRTMLARSPAPALRIVELTTCEVLTGPPISAAPNIMEADASCEVKLWIGRIL